MWYRGISTIDNVTYNWEAKVYDEGSEFGIDGGRISKLFVWKKDINEPLLQYDRGWVVGKPEPDSDEDIVLFCVMRDILKDY